MPTFQNRPLNEDTINRAVRKNPLLFGVPFVLLIVGASFAMTTFTQTRYDLQSQKHANISREEELGLKKNRKKIDIREEYFRIQATAEQDWEPKRVERPKGVPDWGVPPTEPPPRPSDSKWPRHVS